MDEKPLKPLNGAAMRIGIAKAQATRTATQANCGKL